MKTNVMRILESKSITYEAKPHSRAVFTSEEAAAERGVRLNQIVKTMLIRTKDQECIAALIPGDRRLDLKRFRQLVGDKNLELLPREQVHQVTGYEPGAVSPIGMQRVRRIFLDQHLLEEEFVDISSGRPDAGVEIRSQDLLKLLNATVADISQPIPE